MEFEYSISMVWHSKTNTNTKESLFEIKPELINGFAIFSDYDKTNMPIAYATLTLNKAERDKIIKEAMTAYFDVIVNKIYVSGGSTITTPTKYTGKCAYFIDEDINYNKELDYPEQSDVVKANNDILQTFSIGLMWETCKEWNKGTSNDVIMNTSMFNAVFKYLEGVPVLIEPFKYNDTIDKLIINPHN